MRRVVVSLLWLCWFCGGVAQFGLSPTLSAQESTSLVQLEQNAPKKIAGVKDDATLKSVFKIRQGLTSKDNLVQGANPIVKFGNDGLVISVPGAYKVVFDDDQELLVQVVLPKKHQTLGTGGNDKGTQAREVAGVDPSNHFFKNLMLDLARTWGSKSTDPTHKDYVARYDQSPEETCGKIAALLRQAADDLKDPDFDKALTVIKARFETFYADGARNRLLLKNPYVEDWQPFLRALEAKVLAAIPEEQKSDLNYRAFILHDLADGFDQLADDFRGVAPPPGVMQQRGTGAASGGQSNMADGDPSYRKRRRCRCSSLLFGF